MNFNHQVLKGPLESAITFWELLAVVVAVSTCCAKWKGGRVKVYCDNAGAVQCYYSQFSRNNAIHLLLRRLYFLRLEYDFHLDLEHVSGVNNGIADALSRAKWLDLERELSVIGVDKNTVYQDFVNWDRVYSFDQAEIDLVHQSLRDNLMTEQKASWI